MATTLVVGYGNELRCDDASGVIAAEKVRELQLTGVEVITRQQLVPEMSEAISQARCVIFLDATDAGREAGVEVTSIQPSPVKEVLTHACNPSMLLEMAEMLFGHCPNAWCVTIPGKNFDVGQHLSECARAGIAAAVQEVNKLCEKFDAA